jgi:hypothetical protein
MEIANRKTAIMLVSMVSLSLIQSTTAVAAQKLSTEEHAYLEQLIASASAHAAELSSQLHAFFDTKKNKESYRVHVQKFFKILQSVDGTIVIPLEDAIKATSNTEYKGLLEQMYSIVMDLRKNLVDAHDTFKKNEGKGFLAVSNALGNLKEKVGTRLPHLEQQLKQLHTNLKGFDAGLAQAIDNLQKTLPQIFDIKLSNMVIVTRVKQRLDY